MPASSGPSVRLQLELVNQPRGIPKVDFDRKLQEAIARGQTRNDAMAKAQKSEQLSKDELKRRHTDFRLRVSEHIESALKKTAEHFPGFQYETVFGEKGWGGALYRDDLMRGGAMFSRVEFVVRPLGEYPIVVLTGKGTIRNRELFAWTHHEEIEEATTESLYAVIDGWILNYAEQFAAK